LDEGGYIRPQERSNPKKVQGYSGGDMIAAAQDNDDENEQAQNKGRLYPKRKTSGADLHDGERDQSHRRGEKQSPPAIRKWQLFVDRGLGEVSSTTAISSKTSRWKY